MKEIELTKAKAALSQLVDRAKAGEPCVITRDGRKDAIIVCFEEYERITRRLSFADLLLAFPGEAEDIPARSLKPARILHDGGS